MRAGREPRDGLRRGAAVLEVLPLPVRGDDQAAEAAGLGHVTSWYDRELFLLYLFILQQRLRLPLPP